MLAAVLPEFDDFDAAVDAAVTAAAAAAAGAAGVVVAAAAAGADDDDDERAAGVRALVAAPVEGRTARANSLSVVCSSATFDSESEFEFKTLGLFVLRSLEFVIVCVSSLLSGSVGGDIPEKAKRAVRVCVCVCCVL